MPRISRKAVLEVLPKYATSKKRNADNIYVDAEKDKPVCLIGTILVDDFGVKPSDLRPYNNSAVDVLADSIAGLSGAAATALLKLQEAADRGGNCTIGPHCDFHSGQPKSTWGKTVRDFLAAT